ncbi:MAG: ATP-grasp domain-containing protein [Acidobacteria bacterium]|nr:ATP-grasp domain-containing protein [Acidobacteriota bacterium]
MSQSNPLAILCLASYEKGAEFMRECKRQGCRVFLVTSQSIANADWPRESLDDVFLIPDNEKKWNRTDVIYGISYLARKQKIDRIVALDDFDVETAAALREHLRVPGMGDTTARYFRDKLAMRVQAKDAGISVPEFAHVLNYDSLREFMARVPPPWLIKPRFEASATGIKKINKDDELWPVIDKLGDQQSFYVLEKYVPGDIYHVDSIVSERQIVFALANQYGYPPMDVAHQGGIFTTRTMIRGSEDEQALQAMNAQVLKAMGLVRGVSHTEFIKGKEDGKFYFLETSARVGGANIVELNEAASGLNLWAEWAKIEILRGEKPYVLPKVNEDYAGLIVSLARQEYPDTSAYKEEEIFWRMKKRHHVGLVVRSASSERIKELLDSYTQRFYKDFFATQPLSDKPNS